MEVTRSNFQEVLTELDTVLENATFLAIDGEFTGLNSGPDAGAFDTPAQYYAKLRSGSMDFLLVQFGLSVFTYSKDEDKYSQRSYNFYVFPRPLNRAAPDCRFMCQASSISFLANQGFDFNKLFKFGVPYLTTPEEEKLVKRLEERQKARDEVPELIPISDDDRPQIEEICTRIDEFLCSDAEEVTIDKCNAFIRRLVHQEVRMRWPNKLRVESKADCTGHSLVVQRSGSKEEEEQKEAERREKEKQEIKQAVGLSLLLRKIADSGKLIVGHNMLLDLCHMVHQFFGPLPESYREFKYLVHSLFPRLLDTKVICQSQQFKENVPSSNLKILLETVSKTPFGVPTVEPVDGRSYSTVAEKSHEAGYDAYITGLCFIALSNYLGSLQKPEISTVLSDSPLLNPFLNKLLIARLKDVPYINLAGNDPNPSRDHVFHITFPKEWKHGDISQLFRPYGGVYVSWLSDTSAYVGLNRRDQAGDVVRSLGKTGIYRMQTYAEHQATLEGNATTVERKRKLSSSENPTRRKEETAGQVPTNGAAKTAQEEDGWELATGNDLKLSSVPTIIPSPNPGESRSGTGPPADHGLVESVLEEIKDARKARLRPALSLPPDFRNGRNEPVPRYTILRRANASIYKHLGLVDSKPEESDRPRYQPLAAAKQLDLALVDLRPDRVTREKQPPVIGVKEALDQSLLDLKRTEKPVPDPDEGLDDQTPADSKPKQLEESDKSECDPAVNSYESPDQTLIDVESQRLEKPDSIKDQTAPVSEETPDQILPVEPRSAKQSEEPAGKSKPKSVPGSNEAIAHSFIGPRGTRESEESSRVTGPVERQLRRAPASPKRQPRVNPPGSSPSASPRSRRGLRRQKTRLAVVVDQQTERLEIPSGTTTPFRDEETRYDSGPRKRSVCSIETRTELKRPSFRQLKNRKTGVLVLTRGLIVKLVQASVVLFLLYLIFINAIHGF